jgi:hypothetical protein
MVFGCETSSIEKVIILDFHLYKERPKGSPYVILMIILVQTDPGI